MPKQRAWFYQFDCRVPCRNLGIIILVQSERNLYLSIIHLDTTQELALSGSLQAVLI